MTALTIQGYTLHDIDGEPMIEDMELAHRLGYSQPRDIRKIIKRMIETGDLRSQDYRAKSSRSVGGESVVFHLSEAGSLHVATRSETENARDIRHQLIDVFIEYRQGNLPTTHQIKSVGPLELKAKESTALLQCFMSSAEILGMDKPMARAVAVEEVRALGGLDLTKFLANNTVDEAPITATELGQKIQESMGEKHSAKKVNKILAACGMQNWVDGAWVLTEKGREYATVMPYQGRSSKHSGYQTKWYPKVLSTLLEFIKSDSE